ncbi:MAG: hypothetical protein U9N36_08485 [Euryarchaeota archaeon]|nr:hypothetical protein [Euryarchaeota archaeon]
MLFDLPIDDKSAKKIAYNWIRSTIGNIPHVETPVKEGGLWSIPIHANYPRVFNDVTTGRPQKLRFMSFKNIDEVKIAANKGLIIDKPRFHDIQRKISENLTLVQETVQKALSFFFERGYEEVDSIFQVIGPHLTLSGICYERSFEYGAVIPQDYLEIESAFIETYSGAEIMRIKLPRYLVQLEAVDILESVTIAGTDSWSPNEKLFNKMCSERYVLAPIAFG